MKRFLLSLLFLLGMVGVSLHADQLNWDTQADWGDYNGTIDEVFTVGATNITVTIGGTTNALINTTPEINTNVNGTGGGGESLQLATDHSNNTNVITITIAFSQAVDNISFTIFDVDEGDYTDQIRSISSSNGVTTFNDATATGSVNATVANSGTSTMTITGQDTTNDGTNDSNTTLTFSGRGITSLTFTYGNNNTSGLGPLAPGNPGNQWIGIGDITYTVVPEPSTYLSAFLLLVFLGGNHWRKLWRRPAAVVAE
jgi:hypothetical protein